MSKKNIPANTKSRNDSGGWLPARVLFAGLTFCGLILWLMAAFGHPVGQGWFAFLLCYGLITIGALGWVVAIYSGTATGIRNHGTTKRNIQRRGWLGWVLFIVLSSFYVFYYWWPEYLTGVSRLIDPMSRLLRGGNARWFMYSYLYTMVVLLMGIRMLFRYRHSRYQLWRTMVAMFIQVFLAFLVPAILAKLEQPEVYLSYFWPLDPNSLYPSGVFNRFQQSQAWGWGLLVWSLLAIGVMTPVLTYYFGKRWYCSWVCGCGGLAETLGDPFRHLSSKKLGAWKIERWSVHLVLLIITLGTLLLWINHITNLNPLSKASYWFTESYKFMVLTVLAGSVGAAFYPLLGGRVWCRFFCPMAAVLGIIQRYFSCFRITTNGDQCMSCGNCSAYCEMGIDVRSYAQRGVNIVRASCVGCGICSAVCPRGVLNLECTKTYKDRFSGADKPLQELGRSLRGR